MATILGPTTHGPLISALTTFYSLFVDLHHLHASSLKLPSNLDGVHPPHSINEQAARENGFSDAAIALAYRIPYIMYDYLTINYDTVPLIYRKDEDEMEAPQDSWDFAKDPTYQDSESLWAGRDVLVLTKAILYGYELIYDLERQTITEWQHFEGPDDWRDAPAYPMTSPENPLYKWIISFLTLTNLPLDGKVMIPHDPKDLGYPFDPSDENEMQQWRKRVERYETNRTYKNVYVQSGWNVDAAEQMGIGSEEGPIWELIEQARQRAKAEFRDQEFEEKSEEWKDIHWGPAAQ